MKNGTEYIIEKEGVSDTSYEILKVHFKNNDEVKQGDLIVEYETSKTLIEIEAKEDGFFYTLFSEGMSIDIGETVAVILDEKTDIKNISQFQSKQVEIKVEKSQDDKSMPKKMILTDSAQRLMEDLVNIEKYFPENTFITKKLLISTIGSRLFHLPINGIKSSKKLVLIGAGGMIETVIQAAAEQGIYDVVGILDSRLAVGNEILGVPVIGTEAAAPDIFASGVSNAIITFASAGKRHARQEAFERTKAIGFAMVNIIHPRAIVDKSAILGEGNLVLEGAKIGSECVVGNNNYINVGSVLCHHAELLGNIHLAPNSTVGGNVVIEEDCLIGMGVTIVSGCSIGKNTVVNNGVNIISDIGADTVVKGVVGSVKS